MGSSSLADAGKPGCRAGPLRTGYAQAPVGRVGRALGALRGTSLGTFLGAPDAWRIRKPAPDAAPASAASAAQPGAQKLAAGSVARYAGSPRRLPPRAGGGRDRPKPAAAAATCAGLRDARPAAARRDGRGSRSAPGPAAR